MNEQQRQAAQETLEAIEAWWEGGEIGRFPIERVRTVLALVTTDRPTTCFECSTELHGPFCPKCNPDHIGDATQMIADTIRRDCSIDIHFDITNADQVAQAILDRLSAPVRS